MLATALLVLLSPWIASSAAVPIIGTKDVTPLQDAAQKEKSATNFLQTLEGKTQPLPRSLAMGPVGSQWTDPDYWCANLNALDYVAVNNFWENNVGTWLGVWTQPSNDSSHLGPDNWAQHAYDQILPGQGNSGLQDCGLIGSTCDMAFLDCRKMVQQGQGSGGQAYWALQALQGFQNKLNVAHEMLQDTVIDDLLDLDDIASDFSPPAPPAALTEIASILGTCFYMIGSSAGVFGLAADSAGAVARVGAVTAKVENWKANSKGGLLSAIQELDAAKATANKLTDVQKQSGTLGAATYLIGSSFGIASIDVNYGGTGGDPDVSASELKPMLQSLFNTVRGQLATFGQLAVGGGGNYSTLPHQNGTKAFLNTNQPIAGFFSDGKMLMGARDPTFNTTIKNSFAMFKLKIVDYAVQAAGIVVIEVAAKQKDCNKNSKFGQSGYGHQWVVPPGTGGFCFGLFKLDAKSHNGICAGSKPYTCGYQGVASAIYNTLQDKYGINIADYYAEAYKCSQSSLKRGIPDPVNVPTDGSLPTCFYSISVLKENGA